MRPPSDHRLFSWSEVRYNLGAPALPPVELVVVGQPKFDTDGRLVESIGVETLGGVFTPLLEAGCQQPCVVKEMFSTASDNQESVEIHVLRGRPGPIKDAVSLGHFHVTDIGRAPRGVPKIEVSLVATSESLVISARDLRGGRVRVIKAGGG